LSKNDYKLWVKVTAIHSQLTCLDELSGRIVGGQDAAPKTWRWIVQLKKIGCSGNLFIDTI